MSRTPSREQADELSFARGEAAINVYTGQGGFQPHKDCEALTVLVHLSGPPTPAPTR